MSDPHSPNPDASVSANARVAARYDELMREGKHGHYETMFHVCREERERVFGELVSRSGQDGMTAKTAAEINAERIEAIIIDHNNRCGFPELSDLVIANRAARSLARRIVEAFPELRPAQQSVERDGTTRTIAEPLPWAFPK